MNDDFTEQARQLVNKLKNANHRDWEPWYAAIASFAAEAATQGQVAGIERAVEVGKYYEAFYKERLANVANEVTAEKVRHHKDAYARMAGAVSQATKGIATLSPDPSFLNRVRNEAADKRERQIKNKCHHEHVPLEAWKVLKAECDGAATAALEQQWRPIETAPKDEEWCVVGKIGDGQLLWWYRAMFWRGGWHTARSYDTRVIPSHWMPLPPIAAVGDDKE